MHLNSLDIDDATSFLPTTGERLTAIVTTKGVKREYVQKAQFVRSLDVMILGPAMVYAGLGKELPQGLKALMLLTGLGTILYNGYNWFENEKLKSKP